MINIILSDYHNLIMIKKIYVTRVITDKFYIIYVGFIRFLIRLRI